MTLAHLAPGIEAALELLARHDADGGALLLLPTEAAAATWLAEHAQAHVVGADLHLAGDGEVLLAPPPEPGRFRAAFVVGPASRRAPLLRLMGAVRDALASGGVAVVSDVAWGTAPTPDLAQAFAPPLLRERVRPFEGYEMQLEHAGFEILERLDFGAPAWAAFFAALPPEDAKAWAGARAAIAGDARGAARYCAWALRRTD